MSTSTTSPVCRVELSGTILELTFAPTQWLPISLWMAYAKSMGVASFAREMTFPFGVKTSSSLEYSSVFRDSMKSLESFSPPSQLRTSRIQERRSVNAESSAFFSLYFQCAAIPNSAVLCIS